MSNQNQKNEQVKTEEQMAEQQVQQVNNVPVQQLEQAQQIVQAAPQKEGFGAWLKRHWKGVVGGAAALVTAGGSAFVAYRKGKQAGINSVPMPTVEQEDYSLNPNTNE